MHGLRISSESHKGLKIGFFGDGIPALQRKKKVVQAVDAVVNEDPCEREK